MLVCSTADALVVAVVGQIMGPIVQIVIQAPNLARMFFGGYWSNLPDGPLENPRWLSFFFSRWPPFSLFKIIFLNKMHLFGGLQ